VITKIRFPADHPLRRGLKTEELHDLGPMVVLAGPNGGGKSRHLNFVQTLVSQYHNPSGRYVDNTSDQRLPLIEDTTAGEYLHAEQIRYQPGAKTMTSDSISLRDFDTKLSEIAGGSYRAVAEGWRIYLEATARALWNGTNAKAGSDPNITKEYEVALTFNELLTKLIGATVEPEIAENARVVPTLFGRRLEQQSFSVGQQVLVCWAILLMKQGGHYMDKIVLLDEPEVYLHPDICVQAIERLQTTLGEHGQIWIATHSLPLIAWTWNRTDSLYFVQDGKADRASSTPSRVWQTLLGGKETRDALVSFLDGDATAAVTRFAADCLLPPGVASSRPDDPQPKQLVSIVADRLRRGETVRILEIGTGRGRLVAEIVAMLRNDSELCSEQLAYIAYEDPIFVDTVNKALCEKHLEALRSLGAQAHYSTDLAELQARDVNHVDLTVLANTLHEVPVDGWLALFEQVRNASKLEAKLLVIEDQEPRIGELPHPRGFLILEKNECEALVNAAVRERVDMHSGRRLTAFEIPVESLINVTGDRLARALRLVAERSKGEIRRLRDGTVESHKAGRRHAFFAMLHLNATLALEIYSAR
jgi:energy-coupling factor transporter ATP-binding protein EcfA2